MRLDVGRRRGSVIESTGADYRTSARHGPTGDTAVSRWFIVNDGVMGGRSLGDGSIVDGVLSFSGTIETDGGGFSSVRSALAADALDSATSVRLRIRTDGRSYELQADDAIEGRSRRVSHFGLIPLSQSGEWVEVEVSLLDLEARVFGTPVDAARFAPDAATEIGVILADGVDGPFSFEIDWIDACP